MLLLCLSMLPDTVLQLDLDKAKEQRQASSTVFVTAEASNHVTINLFIDDVLSLVYCCSAGDCTHTLHRYPCKHCNGKKGGSHVTSPLQLGSTKTSKWQPAILCMPRIRHRLCRTESPGVFPICREVAGKQRQLARVCLSPARAGCFGDGPWQGSCMAKPAL